MSSSRSEQGGQGRGSRDKRSAQRSSQRSSQRSPQGSTHHRSPRPKKRKSNAHSGSRSNAQPRSHPFSGGGRLTLFGRKPVYEALCDTQITAQRLFLAHKARGELIDHIVKRADEIALPIERLSALELSRISKHGKQDQGVALDVHAPRHLKLTEALERLDESVEAPIFLLDGLNTPANVGMVIRSAWAAGAAGIILPRAGCAPLNPLAVKASAGVAIHAAVWRCESAREAAELLSARGIPLFGLAGEATRSLYEGVWPQRAAWVVGNESEGMSAEVRALLTSAVSLPMANGVESLNAAVAASVVGFELTRARSTSADA